MTALIIVSTMPGCCETTMNHQNATVAPRLTTLLSPIVSSSHTSLSSAGFSAGPSNQGVHCISERHPPLKHHPARTRHGEQIRIPGGLGRIAGQDAVLAMIVDELLKVSEEVHCVSRNEFVGLDHRPTDLPQV